MLVEIEMPRQEGKDFDDFTYRSTRRFSLQPAGFDPPRMRVLRLFRILSTCLQGPILILIGAGTTPICEDAVAEHSVIPCVSRL